MGLPIPLYIFSFLKIHLRGLSEDFIENSEALLFKQTPLHHTHSHSLTLKKESLAENGPGDFYTEALIIGGGFRGIYVLHSLRKQGISAELVEAGADFGGVWHWNRYPGARVDSEFPFYQLSIPDVYKTYNFSERFSSDGEIRRYFEHLDKVLDLRNDATFNTIVKGVAWIVSGRARQQTENQSHPNTFSYARDHPTTKNYPAFPGLETF